MAEYIRNKPLNLDKLKGKVDLTWFGHSGFKIGFLDKDGTQRAIYIDIWVEAPDCAAELKKECPNDADLIMVTYGQKDHSFNAPTLLLKGKRE